MYDSVKNMTYAGPVKGWVPSPAAPVFAADYAHITPINWEARRKREVEEIAAIRWANSPIRPWVEVASGVLATLFTWGVAAAGFGVMAIVFCMVMAAAGSALSGPLTGGSLFVVLWLFFGSSRK